MTTARIAILDEGGNVIATEDVNIDEELYAEADAMRAFRRVMDGARKELAGQ